MTERHCIWTQAETEGMIKAAIQTARAVMAEEIARAYDGWAETCDGTEDFKAHARALAPLPAGLVMLPMEVAMRIKKASKVCECATDPEFEMLGHRHNCHQRDLLPACMTLNEVLK